MDDLLTSLEICLQVCFFFPNALLLFRQLFFFANRNIKSSVEPEEDIIRYAEEEDDTVGEAHDGNFGVNSISLARC